MVVRELAAPEILVDGRPIGGISTRVGNLGGYDLTLASTVGPLAIDVQTSILAGLATETAISHLIQTPGLNEAIASVAAPGGLDGAIARSQRLLEHYAQLQRAVEFETGAPTRIELSDASFGLALYE